MKSLFLLLLFSFLLISCEPENPVNAPSEQSPVSRSLNKISDQAPLIAWNFEGGSAIAEPSIVSTGISGYVSAPFGGSGDPYIISWICWGNSISATITLTQPVVLNEISFEAGHNRYWGYWSYYRPKQLSVELSPINSEPPTNSSQWQPRYRIHYPWNPPADGYAVLGVVNLPYNYHEMEPLAVTADNLLMPGTYVIRFLTTWYSSGWNNDVNQCLYLDNLSINGTSNPVEIIPNLIEMYVTDPAVASGLLDKLNAIAASLERGNNKSKKGQIKAFINQINAQTGKSITSEQAELLIQLVQNL